ncbi:MAG: DUF2505 domain-containing protein [Angustibacter sp.]
MHFTAAIEYRANVEQVFAMITDQSFQEEVCRRTGALEHTVQISQDHDGGVSITTVRVLPSDPLPDFARRFVGDTLSVRRVDTWGAPSVDGTRRGDLLVEITGAPVRLIGGVALTTDGELTRVGVTGDLKASVPLVGGKIEQATERPIRMAIAKEQEVGKSWLAH